MKALIVFSIAFFTIIHFVDAQKENYLSVGISLGFEGFENVFIKENGCLCSIGLPRKVKAYKFGLSLEYFFQKVSGVQHGFIFDIMAASGYNDAYFYNNSGVIRQKNDFAKSNSSEILLGYQVRKLYDIDNKFKFILGLKFAGGLLNKTTQNTRDPFFLDVYDSRKRSLTGATFLTPGESFLNKKLRFQINIPLFYVEAIQDVYENENIVGRYIPGSFDLLPMSKVNVTLAYNFILN
ncbi:MAG: hypothetical protein KDC49_20265 [Saprospiraceae bacterium]|nr:hypothetical protein [Saprospiraceae bacterium]